MHRNFNAYFRKHPQNGEARLAGVKVGPASREGEINVPRINAAVHYECNQEHPAYYVKFCHVSAVKC